LTGNRNNTRKEGSNDVILEKRDVVVGKGKNVGKGADVWDGSGKKMNLQQEGPCVVMRGSDGLWQGQ
jgi:hypothetical protein